MTNRIFPMEPDYYRLPTRPAPVPTASGFVILPVAFAHQWTAPHRDAVAALYQLALEQAQANARPSLPERDLLAVWN
jgi:hypothetical protein